MTGDFWLILGLAGQGAYFMRFFVQWLVSERRRQSTIPLSFWGFSLAGGIILLAYAVHRRDPVFIIGEFSASCIYIRNLRMINRKRTRREARHG